MSDESRFNDDAFVERVARVLGTPERFGDEFEHALVEAIRADRPLRRTIPRHVRTFTPAWWRTPATVRVTPMRAVLLAAGVAAIAGLSTLSVARKPAEVAPARVAQAVHDTVTLVRFVFVGQAKSVALVGDFNRWGAEPTPLRISGANGAWTASVPVPSGRHEYAFIVDGERWVADPSAPTSADEFDTPSSVITVGS